MGAMCLTLPLLFGQSGPEAAQAHGRLTPSRSGTRRRLKATASLPEHTAQTVAGKAAHDVLGLEVEDEVVETRQG